MQFYRRQKYSQQALELAARMPPSLARWEACRYVAAAILAASDRSILLRVSDSGASPKVARAAAPRRNNPVEFPGLPGYFSNMRRTFQFLLLAILLAGSFSVDAASGRVIKVLPQFLDSQGRQTLSPSLFERDAYQAHLRLHPKEVSGMRFAVQWRASGNKSAPVKLRIELRGVARGDLPSHSTLEYEVKSGGWLSHWTYLPILGDDYKRFGRVTAWRATLWEGDVMLSEQKSFLW